MSPFSFFFFSYDKARREEGLEPFHAQDDVFHGARVLVNTAFGLEYPHRLAPLVEMTGPLLPPRVARALSTPSPRAENSTRGGTTASATEKYSQQGVDEKREKVSKSAGLYSAQGVQEGGRRSHAALEGDVSSDADMDQADPLALPFLIRTWLGGTGSLIAPGTAAFEVAEKLQQQQQQQAAATTTATSAATAADEMGSSGRHALDVPSLPDDLGVIYVSLGRMPQLDKWQLVTVLQALSEPSEAICWGGSGTGSSSGGAHGGDDRLGKYRVLWVMSREQRELLLSTLSPLAPPPSFRLKVMGGVPHLGVSVCAANVPKLGQFMRAVDTP